MPEVGIYATLKRLERPRPADGFDEVHTVQFDGAGGFDVTAETYQRGRKGADQGS